MPNGNNSIRDFLKNLFFGEGRVLGRQWLPDKHVLDASQNPVAFADRFVPGDEYVVVRLAEMYLKRTRVLWREFYPVVHAFVSFGNSQARETATTIAGPGQLKDLGTSNLDRVIGLSYPLVGPLVYDGQEIEILVGLYGVPAADGASVLIDTLSQLSGIVPQLATATQVAGILKTGTEKMLGIDGTRLALGLHDSLLAPGTAAGLVARPGFVVAMNRPSAEVNPAELWVREGRLYAGANPNVMRPYEENDYFLLAVHAGPSRAATWATIPALAAHAKAFDATLRVADTASLKNDLSRLYRSFELDLSATASLTTRDKEAIRALVADDLRRRAQDIANGVLFDEQKSVDAEQGRPRRAFRAAWIDVPNDPSTYPRRAENLPLFG